MFWPAIGDNEAGESILQHNSSEIKFVYVKVIRNIHIKMISYRKANCIIFDEAGLQIDEQLECQ